MNRYQSPARYKLASYDFAVPEACKWASRCGLRRAKHIPIWQKWLAVAMRSLLCL